MSSKRSVAFRLDALEPPPPQPQSPYGHLASQVAASRRLAPTPTITNVSHSSTAGRSRAPLKPPSPSYSETASPFPVSAMPVRPQPRRPLGNHNLQTSTTSTSFSSGASVTSAASFTSNPLHKVTLEDWRRHGQLLRARALLEDKQKGGSHFSLSQDLSIERYYRVGERVLEQFLNTVGQRTIDTGGRMNELLESYLIGNRLVKFLSQVLPSHPQYASEEPKLVELRKNSQIQFVELLQYLEELSLLIDEQQYNRYILRDLTPQESSMVEELTGKRTDISSIVSATDGSRGSMTGSGFNSMETWSVRNTGASSVTSSERESLQDRVARVVQGTEGKSFSTTSSSPFSPPKTTPTIPQTPTKTIRPLRPPVPPITPHKPPRSKSTSHERIYSSDPLEDMSWDASFSEFDKVEFGTFDAVTPAKSSWIDLLEDANKMDVSPTSTNTTRSTSTAPSPIPRLKGPPAVPSRSARAQAAAASQFDQVYTTSLANRPQRQDLRDVWNDEEEKKVDDSQSNAIAFKIEERWNQAAEQQKITETPVFEEEGTLTNRNVLHHFRGCVRCLLE